MLVDGYLYGYDGPIEHYASTLTCLDIKTGEKMWSREIKKYPAAEYHLRRVLRNGGHPLFCSGAGYTAVVIQVICFA